MRLATGPERVVLPGDIGEFEEHTGEEEVGAGAGE